ncbi:MAG: right-handed parallel beta-helix repeat-containing protein [Verrucomicrobiia bacterium]
MKISFVLCRSRFPIKRVTLLNLLLVLSSGATEFFVSPRGHTEADGLSVTTALSTVASGVAKLTPGDTLTILPGTYFEAVSAQLTGKPDAPIVIRAQRPGTVLLRGDVDVPRFTRVPNTRYTWVAPFDRSVEGVADRSTKFMYDPVLSTEEVELTLGSYLHDEAKGLLYIHTSDSVPPTSGRISVSVTNGFGLLLTPPGKEANVSDVVIDGLAFTGYNTREYPPPGPGSRSRWGLHVVSGLRVTVRRCTAFLNAGGIFLILSKDCVVEDCHAFGNFARFLDLGNNILCWNAVRGVMRRNRVEGFGQGTGSSNSDITFYSGIREALLQDNLAINAGMMIKGTDDELSRQVGNVVVGEKGYYYRPPGNENLLLRSPYDAVAQARYADPYNHDFRPQGDDEASNPNVRFVSPFGKDANTGTSVEKAWKTLEHAAAMARPGQTVYLLAGRYPETLRPAASGTANAPIRFARRGRDLVVLAGTEVLPVGVDLAGKSHIEVSGLQVHGFKEAAFRADNSESVHIEGCVAWENGSGVAASVSRRLAANHNLFLGNRGAALRLQGSEEATATGNVFDRGGGPSLETDEATLVGLWSNFNDFAPSSRPVAAVGARRIASLDAWRKETGLDDQSLGLRPSYLDAEKGEFSLAGDSELVGRGPLGSMIGPWLRIPREEAVRIADVRVLSTSATTANLEWWTPSCRAKTTLHWGSTPDCENVQPCSEVVAPLHLASLVGLKPGARYHFRVTSGDAGREFRWATHASEAAAGGELPESATKVFTFDTADSDPPPRVFHVDPDGDDSRAGAGPDSAWKTLGHAAGKVRPGDTVLVHAGTYREYVILRTTGDKGKPITFAAAPGERVFLDGVDRNRSVAFRLANKHAIQIEGFRFANFRYVPHAEDTINITYGSDHVVRRCLFDGRQTGGYCALAVRADYTSRLLVENCVMIGANEGVVLGRCVDPVIRHCVFFVNNIRNLTSFAWDAGGTLTLSHNLFAENIPFKSSNALIRILPMSHFRADHNGYFTRVPPEQRAILEVISNQGKEEPRTLTMEQLRSQAGQELHAVMGNPGMPILKTYVAPKTPDVVWRKAEMRYEDGRFLPVDFPDFFADPNGPMGRAADGAPIGLDPAAFADKP